jgi:hypothetical protein
VKPGVWPALAFCLAAPPLGAAGITVTARVIDENEAAVSGAQITVSSAAMSAVPAISDLTGRFTVLVPAAGDYLFDAECAGFFPLKALSVQLHEAGPEVHLVLNHAKEILQSVDVTASPSPIDVEKTDSERRLSGILDLLRK